MGRNVENSIFHIANFTNGVRHHNHIASVQMSVGDILVVEKLYSLCGSMCACHIHAMSIVVRRTSPNTAIRSISSPSPHTRRAKAHLSLSLNSFIYLIAWSLSLCFWHFAFHGVSEARLYKKRKQTHHIYIYIYTSIYIWTTADSSPYAYLKNLSAKELDLTSLKGTTAATVWKSPIIWGTYALVPHY